MDNRIHLTICEILHQWFLENNKVICFICSDIDDLAYARFILFKRWYYNFSNRSNCSYSYEFKPQIIKSEEYNFYAVVLHRDDFINKESLTYDLEASIKNLERPK